jgi:hypothetical protein
LCIGRTSSEHFVKESHILFPSFIQAFGGVQILTDGA